MIAVSLVMVASVGLPVIAMGETLAEGVVHSASAQATSTNAATPSVPVSSGGIPTSPHPGTLIVHKDASGGSPTVDPSVCYYTVCYEPIVNVFETLVNYNGSATATFVPAAATCVPGTVQCTTDYGTNPTGTPAATGFTGMFNSTGGITNGIDHGTPQYWTFVIDPRAHFYDAGNATGWPVYPTDVAYSIVRTVGYSDLPFVARTPGWIVAQSLLQYSQPSFDVYGVGPAAFADHYPFNNTPYATMTSMLINDSNFCPASAMTTMGNGCITFIANGSGALWPEFLDFVVDNLGASIESCGWDSHNGAAIPGFVATSNVHGDGPCTLAGGATSTDASAFQTYLASVAPGTGSQAAGSGMYSWDAWQNTSFAYPDDVPGIQSVDIGSGPYYSSVSLPTGYGLKVNPAYEQPSGCGGDPTHYAQYVGYCDPAPHGYIGNATISWDSSDGPGVAGYQAGTVDLADISPNHISELLSLESEGKINVEQLPSISIFQQSYVTEWSSSYRTSFGFSGTENIPQDFFSYEAARSLLQMSYPFANIENNVWTSDGIKTLIEVGSQLAQGLGCYAPPSTTNGCSNTYTVDFPYEINGGQVNTNPTVPGSAGWWWAQGNNPSSPYYDPEFASCTSGTPCQFSIEGATGAPSQDAANDLWASSIEAVTGGAIKPNTPDITADDLLVDCGLAAPGTSACPIYNFGWIADYPDATDYEGAYGLPSSSYGGPDDLGSLIAPGVTHDNNTVTCNTDLPGASAHLTYSVANLAWWANTLNTTQLPEACQGPAYQIYTDSLEVAAPLVGGTSQSNLRVLIYDLGATIENALNFYTWTGQQYPIYTAAPWINLSTVNTNVVIGAGDVQIWYMIHYVTAAPKNVPVEFKPSGVAKGDTYSVTIGATTLTAVDPTAIMFPVAPNTTVTWTATSPDFYTAVPHTGSVATEAYPATTKTTPVVTLHYKDYGSVLTFKETGLNKKNNTWNVVVNGTFALVATNQTSVSIRLGNGTYPWVAEVPAGYELAAGTTGSVVLTAPHAATVTLKYTPYNGYSATFNATTGSLVGGWCVKLTLEKGTGLLAPKPSNVCSATNGNITFGTLANGTYAFTATAKGKGYAKETGTITVDGANVTQVVTFTKT